MVSELQRQGIAENTVIIFMGDNGFYLGEHGLEGKRYGHEEFIRVPLIIYDPRQPDSKRGIKPRQIALNIDIAPTILSMAGVKVPGTMQRENLFDIVNENVLARQDFFYEHTFAGSPKIPKVEGVVTQSLKYMKYIEHGYEELYDIKRNPHETTNLANNPKYQKQLKDLRQRYADLKKKVQ